MLVAAQLNLVIILQYECYKRDREQTKVDHLSIWRLGVDRPFFFDRVWGKLFKREI